eukprot:TRINITY_DN1616_c0_g5_i1.p1 TRINITY_DN1616_c0_g5~~TRINITY_DN1616_c0_g5_i1.p1  ORF type:complete len:305 (-),score=90.84 TRINITY_DN1616_c0_g5_i1:138-992(-)
MGGGSSFDRKNKYYSTKPTIAPYACRQEVFKVDEDEASPTAQASSQTTYLKLLSDKELELINAEFGKLARNQVIGKRKILQYFGLQELENTVLSTALLLLVKQKKEDSENNFIDWPKFLRFVVVLAKGTRAERLKLFYGLFNPALTPQMTKKQFKQSFMSIMYALSQVTYENTQVEAFKNSILGATEGQLELGIDLYIDEIFEEYGTKTIADTLTYKQWCNWVSELCGMDIILDTQIEPTASEEMSQIKESSESFMQNSSLMGESLDKSEAKENEKVMEEVKDV